MYSRILLEIERIMLVIAMCMMVVIGITGAVLGSLCFVVVVNEVIQYVF